MNLDQLQHAALTLVGLSIPVLVTLLIFWIPRREKALLDKIDALIDSKVGVHNSSANAHLSGENAEVLSDMRDRLIRIEMLLNNLTERLKKAEERQEMHSEAIEELRILHAETVAQGHCPPRRPSDVRRKRESDPAGFDPSGMRGNG